MRNLIEKVFFIIFLLSIPIFSLKKEVEINILDAYVTPEKPHTFKLNFFSYSPIKTKVKINDKYEFEVSKDFLEDHAIEIDFSNYKFDKKNIPYKIISEDENGNTFVSEEYEIILPYDEFIFTKEGSNPISTVLFGLLLYFIPSPNLVIMEKENYFSLTKEIPIITFYGSGYNYPSGSVSLEYTHIYNNLPVSNLLRLGYKHFIPLKTIEYISPGISGFTNFNGYSGVGAEMSIGLFKIYDVFTVFTRYRYNFQPTETSNDFHEISIGLYSHFFTIDL
ncbi:MAG: hypothetical protein H6613_01615 [Ignavibacteriales bacterium]|nr:hypothetical protein [Ignavibacteriales bacterium]